MEVRHPEVTGYDGWHLRGEGQWGSVFDARHTASGRSATVTVVDGPGDEGTLSRLGALVADLAARPDPTGVIVPVLDVGRVADGRLFVAAPASPGWTLQAVLDTHGRCPQPVAAGHLAPIARGLAWVHDPQLVHGGITPSAIVVDGAGRTRLVDVGIAAILGGSARSDLATFAYTPPEAMRGQRLAPAGDVFALGLTLATLVLGHNPLGPEDGEAAFAFVARRTVDAGSPLRWGDVGGVLALVDACVAPHPGDRPTASEVATVLEALVEDPTVSVRGLLRTPSQPPLPDEGPLAPGQLPHLTHVGGQTMSAVGGGGGSQSTRTTSADFADALAILSSVHGPPDSSDGRSATWSTRGEQDGWRSAWDLSLRVIEDMPTPFGATEPPPHARCVVHEATLHVPLH